jgi:hypothetical protein
MGVKKDDPESVSGSSHRGIRYGLFLSVLILGTSSLICFTGFFYLKFRDARCYGSYTDLLMPPMLLSVVRVVI